MDHKTKQEKERLTTFNCELGRRAVLAVSVGGGAAVHTLVRHTNTLDDQGKHPPHLRAPDPLCVCQTLAVMIPHHPNEGQPVKRAAEGGYLTALHPDIVQFHQQSGAGGESEIKAARLHRARTLHLSLNCPPRQRGALRDHLSKVTALSHRAEGLGMTQL